MSIRIVASPGDSGVRVAMGSGTMEAQTAVSAHRLCVVDQATLNGNRDPYLIDEADKDTDLSEEHGWLCLTREAAAVGKLSFCTFEGRAIAKVTGTITAGTFLGASSTVGELAAPATGDRLYAIARTNSADAATEKLPAGHVYVDFDGLGGYGLAP